MSKGKVVVHTDLLVDVDEFANDETKLMMLVDDDNIIPHGEPVERFQSQTEFDGYDHEGGEEETGPLQPRKSQEEKFPFYFFDYEETQSTHWVKLEPLQL